MTIPSYNIKFSDICSDCGVAANYLTCLKRYGARPLKQAFTVSTFHDGICDVCGQAKSVTEQRDFFYPDIRAFKYLRNYIQKVRL